MKRSTVKDYRQALDAYLRPAPDGSTPSARPYGRAPFALAPLRDLKASHVKAWYDGLPYGSTTEKLLMIVRAIFLHDRSAG